MAEQIINATGSQYGLEITHLGAAVISGAITAEISGTIVIGSVSATVESIYIQSGDNITGSFYSIPTTPTLVSANEAGSLTYAGDLVGSITAFIGASSYVKRLTYSGTNNVLVNIGSWS